MSPETFETCLRNYDPALSCRWGHIAKTWVIERTCHISEALLETLVDGMRKAIAMLGHPEIGEKERLMLQKACEEGYSAGYGKRVVIYAKYLDNRVMDQLLLTDLQAPGAMKRIEATKNRRAEEKARKRHNDMSELSRETISIVDWATRRQSSAVEAGKSQQIVDEAFHKPARPGVRQQYAMPRGLLDAFGKPLNAPAKQREVKLQIASS